jgi:hypothetical protein
MGFNYKGSIPNTIKAFTIEALQFTLSTSSFINTGSVEGLCRLRGIQ